MTILKRLLIIPLTLLLVVSLLGALAVKGVNDTLLSPDFYEMELARVGFYQFYADELLPVAVSEAPMPSVPAEDGSQQDMMIAMGLPPDDVASMVSGSFSPAWMKARTEETLEQVVPYIAGRSDGFYVQVEMNEPAHAFMDGLDATLVEAETYPVLMRWMVYPMVGGILGDGLPLGLQVSDERMRQAVQAVVPRDWLDAQVAALVQGMTPYLLGESDGFAVTIPLKGRTEAALTEVKKLLDETDAYAVLYEQVVEQQVLDSIGVSVELPLGIRLTEQEVAAVLSKAVTPQWVQARTEQIIDEATPYLTGETEGFTAELSMVEIKADASRALRDTAASKLVSAAEALPTCPDERSLSEVFSGGFSEMPECFPPNISRQQLVAFIESSTARSIDPLIAGLVPDTVAFTDADLRGLLVQMGALESPEQLDKFMNTVQSGWTYTEADLIKDLRGSSSDGTAGFVASSRNVIAHGWTYTDTDLQQQMASGGSLEDFQRLRTILGWMRYMPWVLFFIAGVTAAAIGLLGGSSWRDRLAWASGALTVASGIAYLLFGPLYDVLIRSQVHQVLSDVSAVMVPGEPFRQTGALMASKVAGVLQSGADTFASGAAGVSGVLLVAALVVLAVSYRWGWVRGALHWLRPRSWGVPLG